jgi:hypothetical protein
MAARRGSSERAPRPNGNAATDQKTPSTRSVVQPQIGPGRAPTGHYRQ